MRSELVFRARGNLGNKYMLCQATAKVTRCLHFASANTRDAIDDALVTIAALPYYADPRSSAAGEPDRELIQVTKRATVTTP